MVLKIKIIFFFINDGWGELGSQVSTIAQAYKVVYSYFALSVLYSISLCMLLPLLFHLSLKQQIGLLRYCVLLSLFLFLLFLGFFFGNLIGCVCWGVVSYFQAYCLIYWTVDLVEKMWMKIAIWVSRPRFDEDLGDFSFSFSFSFLFSFWVNLVFLSVHFW